MGLWYHRYAGGTVSRAMQVTKMLYWESSEVSFRTEVNNGMRLKNVLNSCSYMSRSHELQLKTESKLPLKDRRE
jgi:hypothetical protein